VFAAGEVPMRQSWRPTGLSPLQDILSKRRASLFGHVTRHNPGLH